MITSHSLAAVKGVTVENQQFAVVASVKAQKIVYIGTYDEAVHTEIVPNVPIRIYSAAHAAALTGFGFMLHRLVRAGMRPGKVESWIIPQAEGGSDPDQAEGEIDFAASASVKAGTLYLYIAGDRVAVNITDDMSGDQIGEAVEAAVNADDNLPVTASNSAGVVTFTSKSGGTWGNFISLDVCLGAGEALPSGVVATLPVTGYLTGGVGIPDIQDALDALGTGDAQNEDDFTCLIHGYGPDTGTLDALSVYNGIGNTEAGNYRKEVARPLRSLCGHTVAGDAGLTAALAIGALRKTDRTSGLVCAPGEPYHPAEVAAWTMGVAAILSNELAERSYIDQDLGPSYAAKADRWTNDYDNRELAVQGGVGTTQVKSGMLTLQNIITFYHPDDIEPESNGYRHMRVISILQNVLAAFKSNFAGPRWKGVTLVEDVSKISNVSSRMRARDKDAVIDDLLALADAFEANAWIYNASYTKKHLSVSLRSAANGFDIVFPIIPSGEVGIINATIPFDTSIAILLGGE